MRANERVGTVIGFGEGSGSLDTRRHESPCLALAGNPQQRELEGDRMWRAGPLR